MAQVRFSLWDVGTAPSWGQVVMRVDKPRAWVVEAAVDTKYLSLSQVGVYLFVSLLEVVT